MPLTRAERAAATRAALLRSASSSICELGMQGASIDLVAERAGYTKGAFYAHFASKEELFLAMLDERFAQELQRLDATMAGSGEPTDEAREAAGEFLRYVDRDPEWPRLYQEFAAHAARNEDFRARFAARQRELRAGIADVFARWAFSFGIEPPVDPGDVAAMTFFMADGFLIGRIIDPEIDDGLYATMIEAFLRGLLAMAHAPPRSD
ncbi:MAG TPA: TetR/AcrR family transcriptional regulator [Solirubrobacteraceae bacterium]